METDKILKKKIKTFELKNAERIFPNEITKVTPRDFLRLRIEKSKDLTRVEKRLFERLPRSYWIENSDILVKRNKNKIRLIPF